MQRIEVIKSIKPLELSLEEIHELLELVDSTSDAEENTPERAERVAHYSDRARSCISRLQRHLAYATALLGVLEKARPNL